MVQFRTEKITVLNYFSLWLRLKLVCISTSKTLQKSFWKYLIKLNPDIFLISKYFLKSIFNFQPADPVYMGIFGHVASASSWKENEAKESESGSWRNDANKSRTTTRASTQKERYVFSLYVIKYFWILKVMPKESKIRNIKVSENCSVRTCIM